MLTIKDFIRLVTQGDGYKLIAIRRKDGFVGKTGEYWVDNAIGLSWCTRRGIDKEVGEDWGISKVEVIAIETYQTRGGEIIPCAVIY